MQFTKVGEIGEIMHLAKSGRLIVKISSAGAGLKAGDLLVDASGKRVGRVSELIGPVSSPYASVIPMTDRAGRLAGSKVFAGGQVRPRSPHGGKRREVRRN